MDDSYRPSAVSAAFFLACVFDALFALDAMALAMGDDESGRRRALALVGCVVGRQQHLAMAPARDCVGTYVPPSHLTSRLRFAVCSLVPSTASASINSRQSPPSLPLSPSRAALTIRRSTSNTATMSYETDYDQRDRDRSPRRRSRSPRRSRRSYSPRSRSRSREDYRRSDRRSRSPGGAQAAGGYQSYGSSRGGARPDSGNKETMMQSIRDSSQQDRRVYVGNLSYDVKWHHLKDFMRQGMALAAD
ncbi:hypothetical protein CC80DRAFT_6940 [Byssothecium circinans]|uniref:RRM domain-containing protein n=1 Tax=Byssothecium circinans TaxID=147558 RepID=A0A6A5UKP7_9PLEO|nr:hypothetical protein CC80DRAFT_6940 [Byssothecium circinans]